MLLLTLLGVVALINCCFYILFARFSFYKISKEKSTQSIPVSVVICCKNEAENLQQNLPSILSQDYPNFEIVLINDYSKDHTLEVIETFAAKDPRITIVNVIPNETFWASKKYALTLGIKKAKHELLVFTDADCKPSSNDWLRHMSSRISDEKQIILGYGAHKKQKGIFNKLVRFETLMTAIQYLSYAHSGMPYMGVGRNLAYTKTNFFSVNGFISHIKVTSGDDDLLINETATKKNTAIEVHPDAFTISSTKESFATWYFQKRRHITTANLYKTKHKLLLSTYYACNLFFWVLLALCFIVCDWKITTIIVAFRILFHYISIGKATRKLNEKDLVYFIPFYELFLLLFQMSIFISNLISKPKRWK